MGLKDKVDSLYVAVCGNRITATGILTHGICWGLTINNNKSLASTISIIATGISSMVLLSISELGGGTWKYYKRTLKEFEEQGEINLDFFEERITKNKNSKLMGYCQTQGLYLGAKKTGNLDTFYEAKKLYSNNIIPNF